MKIKPVLKFFLALSVCLPGLLLASFESTIMDTPVVAISAQRTTDFLNSIGVNSAISKRGESLQKTIELINFTGIRWIRSGYEGNIPISDFIQLHQETNVLFSYGLLSGGTDIPRLLEGGKQLAAAGALLAFEGLNEPNNWGITYKGKPGGKNLTWIPVAEIQRDLYQAVKYDDQLKKYPVWSLCENGAQTDNAGLQFLEIPKGAGTLLPDGTTFADVAVCHNYFSHPSHPGLYDNQTWNAADPGPASKVDGLYGNYGKTWREHFNGYTGKALFNLPRVTTETGVTIDGAFTEEKQARLYLNLYLAQFKRNWLHTAIYLLKDRTDEAGNQQFGFYKPDYTPRKSAIYLHNLTSILADKGAIAKPRKLRYTIVKQPETVHDLLLENSNGKFQLIVWGEKVSGFDEIEIDLGKSYSEIKLFDPTASAAVVKNFENTRVVTLTISDHPLVIEI